MLLGNGERFSGLSTCDGSVSKFGKGLMNSRGPALAGDGYNLTVSTDEQRGLSGSWSVLIWG